MARYRNYMVQKLNCYIYNLHISNLQVNIILHNRYLRERVKLYRYIIIIEQLIKTNFPIRIIIVIVLSN